MDFSQLSDDELRKIIDEADESVCPDEASKVYWGRVIHRTGFLEEGVLRQLLAMPVHSSARQLIGEHAMFDGLEQDCLTIALDGLDVAEWSRRQVYGRLLVREFLLPADCERRAEVIKELLTLRLAWALRELISDMSDGELHALFQQCAQANRGVLSRRDRHVLRVDIETEQRKRQRDDGT